MNKIVCPIHVIIKDNWKLCINVFVKQIRLTRKILKYKNVNILNKCIKIKMQLLQMTIKE